MELNTTIKHAVTSEPLPIVSDRVRFYMDLYQEAMMSFIIGVFGMSTNVLNLVIFFKQGVKDCVTICLTFLSFSDLVFVSSGFIMTVFEIFEFTGFEPRQVDLVGVTYVISFGGNMFYEISTSLTAFIAVERCLCVVMPFKFKDFVTPSRALFVIFCIYILNIAVYMPHYMTSGLVRRFDHHTNSTRIVLWLADNHQDIIEIKHYVSEVSLGSLSVLIVLVSTQVMIIGLRKSVEFQTQKSRRTDNSGIGTDDTKSGSHTVSKGNNLEAKRDSSRNKNVIQTVLSLAVICFICNFFRLVSIAVLRAFPDVHYGSPQENLWHVIIDVITLAQTANATVNIFVYYRFNKNFRKIFRSMFCGC